MMKTSIITSGFLHAAVLAWMLFSFGAPAPFEVTNVESLSVDIVPIEDMTQIVAGDKKAPLKEKSAPTPTKEADPVKDAENSGDNKIDLKNAPTPLKRPETTEVAAAPEKTQKVLPKKDVKPNETEVIQKEETEVEPATELAQKSEPKVDVKPDPAEALPDNVPVPVTRPKQSEAKPKEEAEAQAKTAQAKTAKTQDRKKDEKKKETAKSTSSKESDFNADEIASLLNKQETSGGGAKRSTNEAALGGKKTTGTKLSSSEMDAMKGQIENNWSILPGLANAQDVRIQVRFNLDQNGALVGEPEVTATGGDAAARDVLAGGARRAVLKSSPFKNLPPDKYEDWSEVVVDFDPSQLL